MGAPAVVRELVKRLTLLLAHADRIDPAVALRMAAEAAAAGAAPVVLAALAAAAAAVLLQTGLLIRPQAAAPDFSRLDPRRGLKRVFGVTSLLESAKSVV